MATTAHESAPALHDQGRPERSRLTMHQALERLAWTVDHWGLSDSEAAQLCSELCAAPADPKHPHDCPEQGVGNCPRSRALGAGR